METKYEQSEMNTNRRAIGIKNEMAHERIKTKTQLQGTRILYNGTY